MNTSRRSIAAVFAALLMCSGAACGGGHLQSGLPPSWAGGAGGSDAQAPMRLPAACGGVAQASGTTPYGSFDARYVYMRFNYGECGSSWIELAQTDLSNSDLLQILIDADSTGSYLGARDTWAYYFSATANATSIVNLRTYVGVTSFPNPAPYGGLDAGTDPVVGWFTIDDQGFWIGGSFASPVCASVGACPP
jgi:hypothetical protein